MRRARRRRPEPLGVTRAFGSYLYRTLYGLDLLINALTGGNPTETVTARMRKSHTWIARNLLRHFCPLPLRVRYRPPRKRRS